MRLEIISPITEREIARYQEILGLSVEQSKYMVSLHDHVYRSAIAQIETQHAPPLRAMTQRFVSPFVDSPEFSGFFARFRDAEEGLCSAVQNADTEFFAQVELALAESQRPTMLRVRLHRQRQECIPRLFAIRKARIDLALMIEQSNLPADVRLDAEPILYEYEGALTSCLVQADRLCREDRARFTRWHFESVFDENGQARDPTSTATQRLQANLREQEDSARARQLQSQMRVAQVNDQFLPRIMRALPGGAAADLHRTYLAQAYARVYPDLFDPESIYLSVISHKDLPEDHRVLMQVHWERYREAYDRQCAEMERASQRWQEQYALTNSSDGWTEHEESMRRMLAERRILSEDFVSLLRTLLPDEGVREATRPLFAQWDIGIRQNPSGEGRPGRGGFDPR